MPSRLRYDVVRSAGEWSDDKAYHPFVCTTSAEAALAVVEEHSEHKVFVATWSLSEAPLRVRSTVEETLVRGRFTHIFIVYQNLFADDLGSDTRVDNAAFFSGFIARLDAALDMRFHSVELDGKRDVLLVGEQRSRKN